MTARKQPGRRYGPAPKASPHPEMQAPRPMSTGDRDRVYRSPEDFYRLTQRQAKQWIRMAERHDEVVRDDGKGSATPKQKKVRR